MAARLTARLPFSIRSMMVQKTILKPLLFLVLVRLASASWFRCPRFVETILSRRPFLEMLEPIQAGLLLRTLVQSPLSH